ncbi:MAG: hypothetical protein ACRD6N_09555, partial [Pyrinomonadaceae bacterium]
HFLGRLARHDCQLPSSRHRRPYQPGCSDGACRPSGDGLDRLVRHRPFELRFAANGLVSSLGTKWGLFRHYWVLFKLLINVFANIVLLIYMPTLDYFAGVAADTTLSAGDLRMLRDPSAVLHSSLALLLLLVATVLGLYKPRGMTPYGRRKQHEQRMVSQP